MTTEELNQLFDYTVKIRRQIHEYPEVGFELEKTAALVASELNAMGISCTDRYGTCSVAAEVGAGEKILAIRADMDALPVEEKTDLPYRSRRPGFMHACGHDGHTAVLLAVAKYLKSREEELPCKVRLVFQPSEECAKSGAKMMLENGAMDGVSAVLASHCDPDLETGVIGICPGDFMAACIPASLCFYGKTAHATTPERGVDAIAMASESYVRLKAMVKEEAQSWNAPYIWSVGKFCGGTAHNVIADSCEQAISFRFYNTDFAMAVMKKAQKICDEIAGAYGGRAELHWHISTGSVHNDLAVTKTFSDMLSKTEGIRLTKLPSRMGSEDFGWFLTKVPGMLFNYGIRNEALGCTAGLHRNDFCMDEEGLKTAILTFAGFTMNYGK